MGKRWEQTVSGGWREYGSDNGPYTSEYVGECRQCGHVWTIRKAAPMAGNIWQKGDGWAEDPSINPENTPHHNPYMPTRETPDAS